MTMLDETWSVVLPLEGRRGGGWWTAQDGLHGEIWVINGRAGHDVEARERLLRLIDIITTSAREGGVDGCLREWRDKTGRGGER